MISYCVVCILSILVKMFDQVHLMGFVGINAIMCHDSDNNTACALTGNKTLFSISVGEKMHGNSSY